jgi:arabinogalactan oligomer/maltooligosaccharide transport system substrate-binding protein
MTRDFPIKPLGLLAVLTLVLAACTGGQIGATATPGATEPTEGEPSEPAFPEGDITIELWTKEGEPQIAFVQQLADDYTAMHPNVTFNVVNKDVELLREDMVNTALSPDAQPELLWTVLDHVGPFVEAGVVQPLGGQFDESVLAEAAAGSGEFNGEIWVAPISIGNQLMLYYNKSVVGDEAPADSDALIQVASENTAGGNYGLVMNQTESFWLVPFLGGFGGSVFAADGVTPTLNTDEMKAALQFLYDLKFTEQVMPPECDYACASDSFTAGNSPLIVNGDWELANYTEQLGEDLGVAPIPTITETGEDPKPYIGGTYYMVPESVEGDTLTVVLDFINFTLAADQQRAQVEELARLPANDEILNDPIVTDDPGLQGAGEAVSKGVPQPINVEMRCNFDAMTAGIRDVFGGNSDIDAVAQTMQEAAENCIATLG